MKYQQGFPISENTKQNLKRVVDEQNEALKSLNEGALRAREYLVPGSAGYDYRKFEKIGDKQRNDEQSQGSISDYSI